MAFIKERLLWKGNKSDHWRNLRGKGKLLLNKTEEKTQFKHPNVMVSPWNPRVKGLQKRILKYWNILKTNSTCKSYLSRNLSLHTENIKLHHSTCIWDLVINLAYNRYTRIGPLRRLTLPKSTLQLHVPFW